MPVPVIRQALLFQFIQRYGYELDLFPVQGLGLCCRLNDILYKNNPFSVALFDAVESAISALLHQFDPVVALYRIHWLTHP